MSWTAITPNELMSFLSEPHKSVELVDMGVNGEGGGVMTFEVYDEERISIDIEVEVFVVDLYEYLRACFLPDLDRGCDVLPGGEKP